MRADELTANQGTIYLLDDRSFLPAIREKYRPDVDFVLGFDFALKREIEKLGGRAEYVDHMIDRKTMQQENYRVYEYFKVWHLRLDGSDVFEWKGIPFGFAFRQEIWNDFTFYLRLRICLGLLCTAGVRRVVLGTRQPYLDTILQELGIDIERVEPRDTSPGYFFPVFRWMTERVNPSSLRSRLRRLANRAISMTQSIAHNIGYYRNRKAHLFVQAYHPTKSIINTLVASGDYMVTLAASTEVSNLKRTLEERLIPMYNPKHEYEVAAKKMIKELCELEGHKLNLGDDSDVTKPLRKVICDRIASRTSDYIRILDSVIRYFDQNRLDLDIRIANIGILGTLIGQYSEARGVPSYLIINGMMCEDYLDESKYATVINAYSTGMRDGYFSGMQNVVCLGDPRMDNYSQALLKREIDRREPVITIGASGFSNVDLNSYLAAEFDFLYDVLSVLRFLRDEGKKMKIMIKVRSNGYRADYERFTREYFPDLEIALHDSVPIRNLLFQTDFFISIFSQTLFEASILGIPVLYHKKDTQFLQAPFDGNSELVTTSDYEELLAAVHDFYAKSPRYNKFLSRDVMEKYIGFLDGKNLDRNLRFINRLLACDTTDQIAEVVKEF